jgi:hypothetical protein
MKVINLFFGKTTTRKRYKNLHIKYQSYYLPTVMIFILLSGLVLSCHHYFKVTTEPGPATGSISALDAAGKTIVVHFEENKWILRNMDLADSTITGRFEKYDKPPTLKPINVDRPNRYIMRAAHNQSYLLNEVHLYIGEYSETGNGKVIIPVKSVSRLEIYDKDTQSTVGSYILGGLGIAAGAYLALGIIVLLTKESCPFIYTWDGNRFHFTGEVYSGSIHEPLERSDYLRLPFSGGNSLTLKITNEVKEIQHTNLLELLVVDHPLNVEALADKNGKVHTIENPLAPCSAKNLEGKDVKELLTLKDGIFYISCPATADFPEKDGVILTFPKPSGAGAAKIIIRAKNSFILDFMMGQFHDLFGSMYGKYMKKQEKTDAARLRQMALDRGFPLSLFVERNGQWEFTGYFNIAGPMAFRDDILEIPLTGKEPDSLRVKLESGTFLWELDYAAADFSLPVGYKSSFVQVASAIDENNRDVSDLLALDDTRYYTQPETGDQAVVTFTLPAITNDARTVILHSKGWYQVLREPEGKPDVRELQSFRDPARFNRFINDRMKVMGQMVLQGTRTE